MLLLVLLGRGQNVRAEPAIKSSQKSGISARSVGSNPDEAIEILYSEKSSRKEREVALVILTKALQTRNESAWLEAIGQAVRKDKNALDHVLPKYGEIIKNRKAHGLENESSLCNLLDILIGVESVPVALQEELDTIIEAEEQHPFTAPRAAAIILKTQPDREDLWRWFSERLSSDERYMRILAVHCLGRIGMVAKPMASEINELLKDRDVAVRIGAATALWQIHHDAADLLPIARKALSISPATVPLRPRTVSESGLSDHRHETVALLGDMGPTASEAAPDIAKMLYEEDVLLQIYSVNALKKIRNQSPEVLKALRHSSQGPNDYVANKAKEALQELTEVK